MLHFSILEYIIARIQPKQSLVLKALNATNVGVPMLRTVCLETKSLCVLSAVRAVVWLLNMLVSFFFSIIPLNPKP